MGEEVALDTRHGEICAAIVAVGVGAIISAIVGDPTPSYVAAIVVLMLVIVYEFTLRTDPNGG